MGCDNKVRETKTAMSPGTRATHMGCDDNAVHYGFTDGQPGTRATHMGCDCKNNAI